MTYKFTIIFLTLIITGCFNKKLNKESLFEGLNIPVEREFKLSKKTGACEDFHKYVCSETEETFKLPSDRERWMFAFSDNAEKLLHAKKSFFKKINEFKPKTERSMQFKDVYNACMNQESSISEEKSFISAEAELLSKIKTNSELADLAQSRLDTGLTSLTYMWDGPNKENPLINDAIVISDLRSLPERSYYQNKDLIEEFKSILIEFFKITKMDNPDQRAQWVIDFETSLALKAPLPKDIRGRFSEKRDISRIDFLKKYPELKFDRMLKEIPEKTVLIDLIPETNEFINQALKTKPIEELKSVYAFHSMTEYMDDAYPDFFNKYYKFKNKFLGGPSQRPDRQERCTKLVMNQFGMELDYELIHILFPSFPQDRAIKTGESVRQSILKGLELNTWLSATTKAEAINKIKFAKLHLVKPQKDKDWDFMPIKKYSSDKPYANSQLYRQASFCQNDE